MGDRAIIMIEDRGISVALSAYEESEVIPIPDILRVINGGELFILPDAELFQDVQEKVSDC